MKQTTYRMTTATGIPIHLPANSAAEAIEAARWKYRGEIIVECHSGLTDQEAAGINAADKTKKAMAGLIRHDIPAHDPVGEDEVQPRTPRGPAKDTATTLMFSEAEMGPTREKSRNR